MKSGLNVGASPYIGAGLLARRVSNNAGVQGERGVWGGFSLASQLLQRGALGYTKQSDSDSAM